MVVARKSLERGPPTPSRLSRLPGHGHVVSYFTRDAWRRDRTGPGHPIHRAGRVAFLAARGFFADKCLSRASALTYITVLSLVPLLAFSFSVAKGFGFYDDLLAKTINPFLDSTFGPLKEATPSVAQHPGSAPEMREAIDRVLQFVHGTQVSALGFFGLALLLFTVIKLLATIEGSFNDIWGVHRSRSVLRKISDYLAMVIVTPIFLFVAAGFTTMAQTKDVVDWMTVHLGLGGPIQLLLSSMPILSVWIGFTFIYMAMPNTRTRLASAMIGALVAAVLWQAALVLHLKFQIGIARYNAIYSSFAAFPIFLIWINLSWVIVLLGAEIAFAHQSEPSYAHVDPDELCDHAYKERLGLRAMTRIAQRFLRGEHAFSASELALELSAPQRVLEEVLYALADHGILVDSYRGEARSFLPGRDLDGITVKSVLDALKGTDAPVVQPMSQGSLHDDWIDRVLLGLDAEMADSKWNRTLRSIAESVAREEAAADAERVAAPTAGSSQVEGSPARA
jgi:membrane protein